MSAGTPHIPAWKRLGLKLKFAKDEAPTPERTSPIAAPVETNGHKRRKISPPLVAATNGHAEADAPTKAPEPVQVTPKSERVEKAAKAEKKAEKAEKKSKKSAKSTPIKEAAVASVTPQAESEKTSKKRRKSVSFTPDTKSADGTSSKDLYDQWAQGEGGVDAGSGPLPDALKVVNGTKSDTTEKPEKRKKVKKSKSTNLLAKGVPKQTLEATSDSANSHSQSTSTNKSPLVEYLETYHTDRDSWKFNKARQNQIFKHIFDLDKIPSSSDDALIAYIKGLNSEPVRARLRQQAHEIRQKDIKDGLGGDDEDMASHHGIDTTTSNPDGARNKPDKASTDAEREHAAYLFAYRRYKKIRTHLAIEREEEIHQLESPEWQERLARRIRSEQMLKALGEPVVASAINPVREKEGVDFHVERNVPTKVVTANGTVENKKKRKRKRRTAVEDDDSSSDESSSDEEAESQRIEAKFRALLPAGLTGQANEKATKAAELEALRAAERKQLLKILKAKKVSQKEIDEHLDKYVDISLRKKGVQIDSSDHEAGDEDSGDSESEDEGKSKSKSRRTGSDSSSESGESTSSEESGSEDSSEDGQSGSSDDSD